MKREQIEKQFERLKRDSAGFRLACDFAKIQEIKAPVKFYFEL